MSDKLADLLIKMADDLDLQHNYATHPETVMAQYGLDDADKAALRTGNEASIHAQTGGLHGLQIYKLILPYKTIKT